MNKNLLFIQKYITLLDDVHYGVLESHLHKVNAKLPAKLCHIIRSSLPYYHSSNELQILVYNNSIKASNAAFHQLCSHTLRLTQVLAVNYPDYLTSNVVQIEHFLAKGQLAEADSLALALIEVSFKLGNFDMCVKGFSYLILRNRISKAEGQFQKDQYLKAREYSIIVQGILEDIFASNSIPLEDKEGLYIDFFKHQHPALSILSKYAYLRGVYNKDVTRFENDDIKAIISALDIELKTHPYICFPFMLDIFGDLIYYKLNSPFTVQDSIDRAALFKQLGAHYEKLHYNQSFLMPISLKLMASEMTRLFTKYHYRLFEPDYANILADEDKLIIEVLLDRCKDLAGLGKSDMEHRKLLVTQACLQILGGKQGIKEGILKLESFLVTYQQVNLKTTTGTVYFFLMVAYFSLEKYDHCVTLYRRYKKILGGKGIYKGNHLKIEMFYLFAQWQLNRSKQYITKVQSLLLQYESVPPAAQALARFTDMPIS